MTDYKFSIGEIIDDIVSYLEDEPTFYGSELHDNVFNTDYYIIGTYKAEKALEEYGTYKAIGEVIDYEEFHFGKEQQICQTLKMWLICFITSRLVSI